MMSLRSFARSAPRAMSRFSQIAVRSSPAAASRASRSIIRTPIAASLRTAQQASAFSTTALRRAASGETDEELSAKLESEISFEAEVKDNEAEPASIRDFLDNSPFELVDTPGQENVVLTRTFGKEKITVSFSIADLASYDQEDMYNDPALADEDGEGAASSSDGRQTDLAEENAEDEEFDDEEAGVPCRLSIVVEKSNHGALSIEASAQHGQISVQNLFFYKDASLAHASSAEVSHKAQNVYPGPPFGSLDEDLQVLMERYLEERGITTALAVFVPDYMDVKEQREYLAWLNNLKNFVDA